MESPSLEVFESHGDVVLRDMVSGHGLTVGWPFPALIFYGGRRKVNANRRNTQGKKTCFHERQFLTMLTQTMLKLRYTKVYSGELSYISKNLN